MKVFLFLFRLSIGRRLFYENYPYPGLPSPDSEFPSVTILHVGLGGLSVTPGRLPSVVVALTMVPKEKEKEEGTEVDTRRKICTLKTTRVSGEECPHYRGSSM